MVSNFLLPLVSLAALASSTVQDVTNTTVIPGLPAETEPIVVFDNVLFGFDGPRVFTSNTTTWDWWYFDAVSASNVNASVVIVFFAAGYEGFPFTAVTDDDAFTSASITVTFADGHLLSIPLVSNGANVTAKRGTNDVAGSWSDIGFSFESKGNMKTYTLTIDHPDISGEMVLRQSAPPHYPCFADILVPQDTQIIPGVGWANAHPDAFATANFTIKGDNGTQTLAFSDGVGYHDKNWGSIPFTDAVKGWYWGHAKLGSYSVVWFDSLDWRDTEYVSGYVARDGRVIAAGCSATSVKVLPVGAGAAWPPTANSTHPTAFEMEFELPEEEGGSLKVLATNAPDGFVAPGIGRWGGKVTGEMSNGTALEEGTGFWEHFNIPQFKAATSN